MLHTFKNIRAEREALIRIYRQSRNEDATPADTVKKLIDELGKDAAAEIVAAMVVAKGEWDGRISDRNRAWAKGCFPYSRDDLAASGVYYCDEIHPAHMEQITDALRKAIR